MTILGGTINSKSNFDKPETEAEQYIKHLVTLKKDELLKYVPDNAKSLVTNLLNIEAKKRADHDKLLQGRFFKDPLSKVNEYIQLFFSKTENEQKQFVCLIGKAILRDKYEG